MIRKFGHQLFIFIFARSIIGASISNSQHKFHPDVGLNISQLLEAHGYPFEQYDVVTKDGYILGVHRVPYGVRNSSTDPNKPIALMVHGMMSQSIDWLNNEPHRSLGFLLADRGYDVWLMNARGNTYSRRHVTLDPDKDKKEFWDFSWHEEGVYDVTATIDFILESTNQSKLFYFGHSMGTTAFFAMAASLPEYNSKIRLMTALAPVVFMANNPDPYKLFLAKNLFGLYVNAKMFDLHEMWPHSDYVLESVEACCYEGAVCYDLCVKYFNFSFGYSPTELNMTMLPVHLSNTPSGYSAKEGLHYLQLFNNGAKFRQYDYSKVGNLLRYGHWEPPEYNLTNVVTPVALHYAIEDQTSGYKDVEHLIRVLPNCVRSRLVPLQHFTHLDFIWGEHANTLVYESVFEDLKKY